MRAAGITAGIAEVLSPEQELSPRHCETEVSGGVEIDVLVGTGRAEFIAVAALWRGVGEAQIDVGLLGVGITDVACLGVAGEFGGVARDEVVLGRRRDGLERDALGSGREQALSLVGRQQELA